MSMYAYIGDYIIYTRISSPGQHSLEHQVDFAKEYAKNICGVCKGTFSDTGSGTKITDLKGLQDAYNMMYQNKGLHIIVYEISRLGRDQAESIPFISKMCDLGTIHSVSERVVMGEQQTSAYAHQRGIELVHAAVMFSINLGKRIGDTHALKKKNGEETRRTKIPFGFKVAKVGSKRYLVQDPSTFQEAKRLVRSRWVRGGRMTKAQLQKYKAEWKTNMTKAEIGRKAVEAELTQLVVRLRNM